MVSNVHLTYQYSPISKECTVTTNLQNATVLDVMNFAALPITQSCSNNTSIQYIVEYIRNIGMRLLYAVAGEESWPPVLYNTTVEGWQLSINGNPVNVPFETLFVRDNDSIVFNFQKY